MALKAMIVPFAVPSGASWTFQNVDLPPKGTLYAASLSVPLSAGPFYGILNLIERLSGSGVRLAYGTMRSDASAAAVDDVFWTGVIPNTAMFQIQGGVNNGTGTAIQAAVNYLVDVP